MDDTILSLGDLRLSAHLATPPPPGRGQGLVVCHGFPNGPRGAATVGTTYADLADRLAARLRLRGAHVQLPRHRHVGGRLLGAGLAARPARRGAHVGRAARRARRVDASASVTARPSRCARPCNDDLVRGVAAIAARTSLGDWVRDPGGLVAEAREMGMIRTRGLSPRHERLGARSSSCSTPRTRSRRLADRPLLILHGVDDIDVPVDEARRRARPRRGPTPSCGSSPGAGHHLRHDPRALATLLGWLDRQA